MFVEICGRLLHREGSCLECFFVLLVKAEWLPFVGAH